jgi:integrase
MCGGNPHIHTTTPDLPKPHLTMAILKFTEIDGVKTELEVPEGVRIESERRTEEGASITLVYGAGRLVLRQRSRGSIEAEGHHTRGPKTPRTGANTLRDAIQWGVQELDMLARRHGVAMARDRAELPAITASGARTLMDVRRIADERAVWGHVSPAMSGKYNRTLEIAIIVFGPERRVDQPWSQSDVNRYYAMRCGSSFDGRKLRPQELAAHGIREAGIRFPAHSRRRAFKPAKPITAKLELQDLRTILNYVKKETVEGARFLTANPLHDLNLGNAVRGKRADYHMLRFRWLARVADDVDPSGALRLVLFFAFLNGRRIAQIMGIRLDRLAFTKPAIWRLLDAVQPTHQSEPTAVRAWAETWVNGAIHWDKDLDKEGFDRVTPLGRVLRREVDRYLRKRATLLEASESVWFFPSDRDFDVAVDPAEMNTRLRAAEALARPLIEAEGLDPEEIMQETPNDAFHPARGWAQVRRAYMGWGASREWAYVGGWTTNTGRIQETVYGEIDPRLMQAVMDNLTLVEASERLGIVAETRAALDPDETSLDGAPVGLAA